MEQRNVQVLFDSVLAKLADLAQEMSHNVTEQDLLAGMQVLEVSSIWIMHVARIHSCSWFTRSMCNGG